MPHVAFSIPSEAEAVRWACMAVRGILEGLRLDDDDLFQVELAVSEAVTNTLRHAYGGKPGHEITLRLIVEARRLVIEVSDTGVALDPARIENADLPSMREPQADHGGRGLFLIREAMDDVRLTQADGRNTLTLVKHHGGIK